MLFCSCMKRCLDFIEVERMWYQQVLSTILWHTDVEVLSQSSCLLHGRRSGTFLHADSWLK